MTDILDIAKFFSERMREFRGNDNQATFAKKIKQTQPLVSRWENLKDGEKIPSISTIFKIAEELEVPALSLILPLDTFHPPSHDDKTMIDFIVTLLEDKNNKWKVATNICEMAMDDYERVDANLTYQIGICTKEPQFFDFIEEYKKAIKICEIIKNETGEDFDKKEEWKKEIIKKHLAILQGTHEDKGD